MRLARDLPIQRKVLGMTMLICGTVLCVAMGALFAFQVLNFRSNFQRDTTTLAIIIANNSTAAMAFKEDQTAFEIVGALQAEPSIKDATLALPNGSPLAWFRQVEDAQAQARFPPAGTCRFVGGNLLVTQPVKQKGEQLGTLYLRADYRRILFELISFYGKVVLGIMLLSIGLGVVLSSRLGRTITDPILHLAQTARAVGESKDYSLRFAVDGRQDELGWLGESFNQMLSQLDKLNRQLIGTSRLAGMAEVATGVLHNVGNVLNSVSVSATAVAERLRRSKLSNLRRATVLLREQNGHLAEFLAKDPKGKILPEYFASVTEQLESERKNLLAKMGAIEEHIEHIKEIVAMQQSYAKVSGVYENLPVVELVEDALRMNSAAFERHGVELVREFAENMPPVCVDRHKVLQILINLLRNAKYAMESHDVSTKRLVVRVGLAAAGRVRITVVDNGIGIAPEHLTKIFGHGFTTKRDGHGFGLHSGANAAREMGGTLTARSEGLGKGAEFTLELPTARARQQEPKPLEAAHDQHGT